MIFKKNKWIEEFLLCYYVEILYVFIITRVQFLKIECSFEMHVLHISFYNYMPKLCVSTKIRVLNYCSSSMCTDGFMKILIFLEIFFRKVYEAC